jgi:hypothetical protein
MSMKDTKLPAYNPAMPAAEKDKVIQETQRMLGQAMMATGCKVIAKNQPTEALAVDTTPTKPAELTLSFVGSDGLTQIFIRLPFSLAGGAARLFASLWLDGEELDRNTATTDEVTLYAAVTPSKGQHTLHVQVYTDAGTASLFDQQCWGAEWVLETLL